MSNEITSLIVMLGSLSFLALVWILVEISNKLRSRK
jgi:hypothetical protein